MFVTQCISYQYQGKTINIEEKKQTPAISNGVPIPNNISFNQDIFAVIVFKNFEKTLQ